MKTLTVIIIIAGVVLAIISGIAILNVIQDEDNKETGSTGSSDSYSFGKETTKHLRVVGDKLRPNEQATQNPLVVPIIVLFIGLSMIAAGTYDLRAPSLKSGAQPPGPI
jgi:hypothetical protein